MKRFIFAIGLLGLTQFSLWAWSPPIVRWQLTNALATYGTPEAFDVAFRVWQESMAYTFVEAAVLGTVTVLAALLMLQGRSVGWHLWLGCLGLSLLSSGIAVGLSGFTPG